MSRDSGREISRRSALQKGGITLTGAVLGLSSTSTSVVADPTEIDECTTITEPGEYVLTDDIDAEGDCFEFTGSDIVLNGNGHSISGNGTGTGIFVEGQPTLRNLTVEDFETGYYIAGMEDSSITLENSVVSNTSVAITGDLQVGVSLANSTMKDNGIVILGNEAFRITISESVLRGNEALVATSDGNFMEVKNSTIEDNGNGIFAGVGTFVNNTIVNNGGPGLQLIGVFGDGSYGPVMISGNDIQNNAGPGIKFSSSIGNIRQNTITNNQSGILMTDIFQEVGGLPPDHKISNNIIKNNSEFGIDNNLEPLYDGRIAVRASCNYWGDPTGPVHPENPFENPQGDRIDGDVEFIPWSVTPIQDGEATCIGGQPIGDFQSQPTDPDGDGLYEDINGDGKSDIVDVQALFKNRENETIQDNANAFDFNGDGAVNVVDVQKLFSEVLS